ncbi:hypothetical protein BCR36DRAFT_410133 [Piromyces finnis]|uniref:Dickkopf N-terminal cysteine-rich domain-containing protein n=1 Tax=Piromyces finnis TaxID=1754191 RepID=A0A1Y1VHG9_9FUNG|nr:hypothetical protein BCR36DRAFT_410133 [Piromyces finnis]|eukprot:ORX56100.1 hypothetical protein BCR36DRAFT_410133 [Piromyces finnis]
MVKLQTSTLLKTTLFWLNCNIAFGQSQISTTQNKECQTLLDCSEGAIDCRKNAIDGVSYCIYPDHLYENHSLKNDTLNEFPTKINSATTVTSTVTATPTMTSSFIQCTTNEECPSNKCVSGYCEIPIFHEALKKEKEPILKDTIIPQEKKLILNCTTNEDCPSHRCISNQCQMEIELAALNICQSDNGVCGKMEGEKCEKDSECIPSLYCDKNNNSCSKKNNNKKNGNTVSTRTSVIVVSSGFFIGFVLILLLIKKDREEKAKEVKEQYIEYVQQPMYMEYSEDVDIPIYAY